MLQVNNSTPFVIGVFPGRDKDHFDDATVLVKASFTLASSAEPSPAEAQAPIVYGEEFHGAPDSSSIRYESDYCPAKCGTDVVLVGHAYAPPGGASAVDVTLVAGPLKKTVRVFGDRVWRRQAGAWRASDPARFERIPLVYERAFGGADRSDADPASHAFELRNPVGVGFWRSDSSAEIEDSALPNIEDPATLLAQPGDVAAPAGFGFIGRGWQPRIAFAGTYDATWQAERCPLLPDDFDPRFHSGAHPDLIAPEHLRGGEPVLVQGASPEGELRFALPRRAIEVVVTARGKPVTHTPRLDTVVIEPDEKRVALCYRVTFRCPRSFLHIDEIAVREARAS
jgi:hypothetical protein